MGKKYSLIIFIFVLGLVQVSLAATIDGTIYDIYFNKIGDVIVDINTTPEQKYLSKDGTYSFSVPLGTYELEAKLIEENVTVYYIKETIDVKTEGTFRHDLFLIPNISHEELEEIAKQLKIFPEKKQFRYDILLVIIIIILVTTVIYLFIKDRKRGLIKKHVKVKKKHFKGVKKEEQKEETREIALKNELKNIINIIREADGRITQKELRKKIPLSEAKISLMVAELEDMGLVKKIKKGRSNIIILK